MTVAVLQTAAQIDAARRALVSRGVSRITPFAFPLRVLRRLGLTHRIPIGEQVKSWDVEKTAEFLDAHIPRSGRILDLGTYASELPHVLLAAGYRSLYGIDTNPGLSEMPMQEAVHYLRADFHHAPLRSESVDAVTAISVIEHGYAGDLLFREVSRLLRPGGYFLASTDYWPEETDTSAIPFFGLTWTIFSRQSMLALLETARRFDLHPVGPVALDARDAMIHWNDRSYTFAWLALQKGGR